MKKMNILLVDDERDFLEVMGARIEGWGYNLIKAQSGQEAISIIENKSPDAIVLDYMMPKMDGIATLKKIRKMDKKVPVILFTAYPDEGSMEAAKELGVTAFIPKLSTLSDVQTSLKSVIEMIEKRYNC